MKTMTQLCESIMDDLDVQDVSPSAVLAAATKMDRRAIEDYPYMLMFIMPGRHYLYKDRQKIKRDVIAFLEQFTRITEYSDIVFDKDPGDTTFSFGFEHDIHNVVQFYRLFTGMIGYMRRYLTGIDDYEFIIKDFAKDKELCRMNKNDVDLFHNIQMNRTLGNTRAKHHYEEPGSQMAYLQEACADFLGLSYEEIARQMARLFNVRFEFYDKDDEDDNLVIREVYLNRSLKTMTQLCESIMDDLR